MKDFETFFNSLLDKSKGEKGIEFEKYCLEFLQERGEKAWRYEEYAKKIDKTLPAEDCGVDIIIEKDNNTIQIVQCKFKGNKKMVYPKQLGTTLLFKMKYKNKIVDPIIIMCTSLDKPKFFSDMSTFKFYLWNDFVNATTNKKANVLKMFDVKLIDDAETTDEILKIPNIKDKEIEKNIKFEYVMLEPPTIFDKIRNMCNKFCNFSTIPR